MDNLFECVIWLGIHEKRIIEKNIKSLKLLEYKIIINNEYKKWRYFGH